MLIYGIHSVMAALQSRTAIIAVIYYDQARTDSRMQEILSVANDQQVTIQLVSAAELLTLTNVHTHQGIAAELASAPASLTLAQHLTRQSSTSIVMILDGITDIHNFGAIIRSCECFGVDCMIIPKNNAATVNAAVTKVSAGATSYLPIITVNNIVTAMQTLKLAGYWLYSTSLSAASTSLFQMEYLPKIAWVLGNEAVGIRRLVSKTCDVHIHIPLVGCTQSLNVAVAAGIVLAHTKYLQSLAVTT